jgi:uncharacterized OsmC-like protein
MQTDSTHPISRAHPSVDPEELARHIAQMYRDVANEGDRHLHFPTGRPLAEALGYPAELLDRLPAAAVSSFAGVGHHLGLARLRMGERVLDLGSGSGIDVFAAAAQVGRHGSVVGVDITPEQLLKAERLARDDHVSFRSARIEELPFEAGSFDVVISNGVVNLSPDKQDRRRTDTGANPAEYLLHALAACLTTSIVYVAAARKVELTSVESTLTGDMDVRGALGVDDEPRNGFEAISVSFRVTGHASEEKLREVVERAKARSAVYDMVTNGVPVAVEVSTD